MPPRVIALPDFKAQKQFATQILRSKQAKALSQSEKAAWQFHFKILDRSGIQGDEFAAFLKQIKNTPTDQRFQILLRVEAIQGKHWHVIDLAQTHDNQLNVCIVDAANITAAVVHLALVIHRIFPNANITYIYSMVQKNRQDCLLFAVDNASYLRKIEICALNSLHAKDYQEKNLLTYLPVNLKVSMENFLRFLNVQSLPEALLRKIPVFMPIASVHANQMPDIFAGLCRDTHYVAEMQKSAPDFWSRVPLLGTNKTIAETLDARKALIREPSSTGQVTDYNLSIQQKAIKWNDRFFPIATCEPPPGSIVTTQSVNIGQVTLPAGVTLPQGALQRHYLETVEKMRNSAQLSLRPSNVPL